jgi:B12-binding domain/radical SAM domain protein
MSKNAEIIFVIDKFNRFSVRALLCAFEKFFPEIIYRIVHFDNILAENPENKLILFSFNTLNHLKYVELSKVLKNKNITVCGGPHPSARPEKMLEFFDAVCIGEGEYVLKEIVENYLGNTIIKGIYKNNQKVSLDDFDAYPKKTFMFGAIEIMRGCQYRCKYCQTPSLFPGRLRHRSIENILENITYSFKRGKKDYRFISPDAASYMYNNKVNIEAIFNLLSGIKKITEGKSRIFFGSFPSEINPYYVTEDLVKILRDFCHNKRVVIGLQTASRKQLKNINRPENIEKVEESISLFLKYNFSVDVDFIFGLPYETEETLKETFEWINKWHSKVRIHSHFFMPLPGSRWENETPSIIPEEFEKEIKRLEGKGRIFGQWITQLKISQSIKNKEEIVCPI